MLCLKPKNKKEEFIMRYNKKLFNEIDSQEQIDISGGNPIDDLGKFWRGVEHFCDYFYDSVRGFASGWNS